MSDEWFKGTPWDRSPLRMLTDIAKRDELCPSEVLRRALWLYENRLREPWDEPS